MERFTKKKKKIAFGIMSVTLHKGVLGALVLLLPILSLDLHRNPTTLAGSVDSLILVLRVVCSGKKHSRFSWYLVSSIRLLLGLTNLPDLELTSRSRVQAQNREHDHMKNS